MEKTQKCRLCKEEFTPESSGQQYCNDCDSLVNAPPKNMKYKNPYRTNYRRNTQ